MRPISLVVTVVALMALAGPSVGRADIFAPNTVPALGSASTILRADAARQYQQYLAAGEFAALTKPILITGIQVRLPDTTPGAWPATPVTFSSYTVKLGVASLALLGSGGVFDPGVPFLGNMVNPVTVYNGSLTVPANAFQPTVSSLEIRFNLANYTLRPGDNLVVYVSHSASDQPAISTPGFETVDTSTNPTASTAVFGRDNTSPDWASSGGQPANPYLINFVTDPRLINVSTRARVETGADIMIGGFVIGGSVPKKVLVRALGPSLAPAGVPNPLADPVLLLFQGPTPLTNNDNWQSGSAANTAAIQATGFAPGDPREPALIATLPPGAYTAQVLGVGGSSGAALIEVYDIDSAAASTLINLSTRAKVQTGNDIVIAGIAIRGAAKKVLVRGLGPSLTAQNVPGALQDPTLEIVNQADGQTVATNNNWQDGSAANTAAIRSTGLAPTDPRESTIFINLAEGNYTALLRGAGSTSGVGLVEIYEIP